MTATVARCLRIVGIRGCLASNRPLQSCACFARLTSARTKPWIEERLAQELSDLRSGASPVREA
jgi:hypothetical protein